MGFTIKDLARHEAELVDLGDAYVDFGHHSESLNNLAWSVEQGTALEVELECIRKVIQE